MRTFLTALLTTIALGTALSAPIQARAEFAQPPGPTSHSKNPPTHFTYRMYDVAPGDVVHAEREVEGYDGPEWWMVVGLACLYSVPVIVFVGAFAYVTALVVGRLRDDRGSGVWLDAAMASRRRVIPPRGLTLIRF